MAAHANVDSGPMLARSANGTAASRARSADRTGTAVGSPGGSTGVMPSGELAAAQSSRAVAAPRRDAPDRADPVREPMDVRRRAGLGTILVGEPSERIVDGGVQRRRVAKRIAGIDRHPGEQRPPTTAASRTLTRAPRRKTSRLRTMTRRPRIRPRRRATRSRSGTSRPLVDPADCAPSAMPATTIGASLRMSQRHPQAERQLPDQDREEPDARPHGPSAEAERGRELAGEVQRCADQAQRRDDPRHQSRAVRQRAESRVFTPAIPGPIMNVQFFLLLTSAAA